jgi:subfamily B ATP-binding cassette protein MsbA
MISAIDSQFRQNESKVQISVALKYLWRFVSPYQGKFILGIILLLLAVPLGQFAIFLTRDVTNNALTAVQLSSNERWETVIRVISIQFCFWLASNLLSVWREVLEWYTSMKSTFDLRIKFYKHLQQLPMSFLSKRTPGEHLYRSTADMVSMFKIGNRIETVTPAGQMPPDSKEVQLSYHYSNDVDPFDPGVMGMITRSMPLFVETLYSLGWGAALLYLIDPLLSICLVLYIIPFSMISYFSFNRVQNAAFRFKANTEIETGVLRDSIAGMRVLKSLGRTRFQLSRYFRAAAKARSAGVNMAWQLVLTQNILQQGMRWLFTASLYLYLAYRIVNGQATIGDWVATALLIEATQMPLQNFVQLLQLLKMQAVPASRIVETMQIEPTLVDKPDAISLAELKGEISFENVDFSYEEGRPALSNLSFTIQTGAYIGIVGPSGAGKSSVANLALRLYAPDSGRVLVDGKDLNNIRLQSYLDQVGTVPQTTYLYSGTVRDNILFGNPYASDSELELAVAQSGLESYVTRHCDGLDSWIEDDANLSGGERQRIGIARALVRNAKLLVLDEATGSLDPATEQTVLETIETVRKDRTVISIAHRLKAVVPCDQIYVLDQGQIVQQGTHTSLISEPGLYKELWSQQSEECEQPNGVPID